MTPFAPPPKGADRLLFTLDAAAADQSWEGIAGVRRRHRSVLLPGYSSPVLPEGSGRLPFRLSGAANDLFRARRRFSA